MTKAYWEDKPGSKEDFERAFGVAKDDRTFAGALVFTDARVVCLAVRSLYGTFAWVTCPLALRRLARDLGLGSDTAIPSFPPPAEEDSEELVFVPESSPSVLTGPDDIVYLHDFDFKPRPHPVAELWAGRLSQWLFAGDEVEWQQEFMRRFALLTDDSFDFFCETGTEVAPHVAIDPETKTVRTGPWYQEAIPSESIMAGTVWCDWVFSGVKDRKLTQEETDEERERLLRKFCFSPLALQIGGSATTGKGRVRCLFTGEGDKNGK